MVAKQTTFFPSDPQSLSLGLQVRAALPKLFKQAERWSVQSICPTCGDHKSRTSRTCRKCYYQRRDYAKAKEGAPYIPAQAEYMDRGTRHGRGRSALREGVVREQPKRPRMVKQADGSWAAEEVT